MKRPGVLIALGFTLALIAWAFAPGSGEIRGEIGSIVRWVVLGTWCLGGALAGGGALMPFGLTRWGVVLGIVVQIALLAIVVLSHKILFPTT